MIVNPREKQPVRLHYRPASRISRHVAPLDSSASGREGNRGTTALSSAGESWRSVISAHFCCDRKRSHRQREDKYRPELLTSPRSRRANG